MKKNKNGITLIALVITIIVLLILAGISISLVTGQNGVLTRADEASATYSVASAKEQAQMKAAGYVSEYMEKVYVNNDSTVGAMTTGEYLLDQINGEEDGDYQYSVSGSTITVTSKTTGEALASGTVDDNGGISWNDSVASNVNSGNNSNNTNNTNTNTNTQEESIPYINTNGIEMPAYTEMGTATAGDYTSITNKWQVLYSDDSNIYLIHKDFLENKYVYIPTTGIAKDGNYDIKGTTNRELLFNYLATATNWENISTVMANDLNTITGTSMYSTSNVTTIGGPLMNQVEKGYQTVSPNFKIGYYDNSTGKVYTTSEFTEANGEVTLTGEGTAASIYNGQTNQPYTTKPSGFAYRSGGSSYWKNYIHLGFSSSKNNPVVSNEVSGNGNKSYGYWLVRYFC